MGSLGFSGAPLVVTGLYTFGAAGQAAGGLGFLSPGWNTGTALTTEANAGLQTATRNATLRRFFVRHGNPGGAAGDITYTLRINGIDSAAVLVLGSGSAGPSSDLITLVNVNVGDSLSVRVDCVAGVGASQRLHWIVEYIER